MSRPKHDHGKPEGSTIDVFGIADDSIVDGPGLRFALFVQGCSHGCPGCHNPDSHPHGQGTKRTVDELYERIVANRLVRGVTISGGEPFEQAGPCGELASRLKDAGYDVWAYSGYLIEDLMDRALTDPSTERLLGSIDVLVDGPFVESQRSFDLRWRGSRNQRVLDVPASLASGQPVELPL